MSEEIVFRNLDGAEPSGSTAKFLALLKDTRNVRCSVSGDASAPELPHSLLKQISTIAGVLKSSTYTRESDALASVYSLCLLEKDFGGLGHQPDASLSPDEENEVLFLVSAWLESLNSADRSRSPIPCLTSRPSGRRGMTMSEKIFAAHDIDRRGEVKPGDVVRVDVDWIMASELSWSAMERDYVSLGKPGIFRNDRFWLAGDHVVDPRINKVPKVQKMVDSSERAAKDFRMTEYQGMNYTIMHTEFCRERAQPGMLIIGSDSHTCSAGSMGALAIGLGVADVTMPLITGETWFKIPETVEIRFINSPPVGIGGKDTILYILKELKRNTVASDRIVEYTGLGLQHLSCDARFAIANMTTEFGGISGVFVPDQITHDFISHRKNPKYKRSSNYFRPDKDAQYAVSHIIDLEQVESFVARYPRPDDVVPVSEMAGTALDGCFIGACTTAEEDLILGAMVLEIGFKKGLVPKDSGKRRVVPGSRPILNKLRKLGFAEIYEKAGFVIGVPGCSYCVGMGADKAGEGEVWITSQNRNFENRMGTGSIGHLGSAATVAASSFSMSITDPRPFLDEIDQARLKEALGILEEVSRTERLAYVEPGQREDSTQDEEQKENEPENGLMNGTGTNGTTTNGDSIPETNPDASPANKDVKRGKIQVLGDFIDTDALAPAEALTTCTTNEEFGEHCLVHTHPEFRARAKSGYNIVVAGVAFGCGSSRENAVSALLGTGVQAVIAKSFAFIYGRNQPNLGLLGIVMEDESFYEMANDGKEIEIDVGEGVIKVFKEGKDGEVEGEWKFQLSPMERELIAAGGLTSAFRRFGKSLFEVMCAPKGNKKTKKQQIVSEKLNGLETEDTSCGNTGGLQW